MELFHSPDLNSLDFCLCVWMKSDIYKINVDTPDKLVARNMDAAATITEHEDRHRRTTRDLRTRVAKCNEDESGIIEHLFRTVPNLSFLSNIFVICTLKYNKINTK